MLDAGFSMLDSEIQITSIEYQASRIQYLTPETY